MPVVKSPQTDEEIDHHIATLEVPSSVQGFYRKALEGRSRTAAIRAFCLYCQGFEDRARAAVRDCEARGCPLWAVRPYQVAVDGEDGEDEEEGDDGD